MRSHRAICMHITPDGSVELLFHMVERRPKEKPLSLSLCLPGHMIKFTGILTNRSTILILPHNIFGEFGKPFDTNPALRKKNTVSILVVHFILATYGWTADH